MLLLDQCPLICAGFPGTRLPLVVSVGYDAEAESLPTYQPKFHARETPDGGSSYIMAVSVLERPTLVLNRTGSPCMCHGGAVAGLALEPRRHVVDPDNFQLYSWPTGRS